MTAQNEDKVYLSFITQKESKNMYNLSPILLAIALFSSQPQLLLLLIIEEESNTVPSQLGLQKPDLFPCCRGNASFLVKTEYSVSPPQEMVAAASPPISLKWASTLPKQLTEQTSTATPRYTAYPTFSINSSCSRDTTLDVEAIPRRRQILLGVGALAANLLPAGFVSAEEVPAKYKAFVDAQDGYSYYYPSDWRDFDFRGHDSAFKDRYLALQNVRVSFIPTTKSDIHELGPMEEVIYNLLVHKLAAPTQKVTIFDMKERSVDGKNYYTFEYDLASPNFSRTAFATIAIANGRYYTLIVGANERRWRRVREQLKVVADSFTVRDI